MLARDLGEHLGVHDRGPHLRELALGELRVRPEDVVGDDEAEHRVAEELEPLVRRLVARARRTTSGARAPASRIGWSRNVQPSAPRSRASVAASAASPAQRPLTAARPLRAGRRRSRPRRATVRRSPRSSSSMREADGALAELLLERLDQLDQRERVGVEVVGEAGVERDRVLVDLEDLGQALPDDPRAPRRDRRARARRGSQPASATASFMRGRRRRPRTQSAATRRTAFDDRHARTTNRARSRRRRRRRAAPRRPCVSGSRYSGRLEEQRHDDLRRPRCASGVESSTPNTRPASAAQRALERLSATLPVKPSVTITSTVPLHEVAALDVADEPRHRREQRRRSACAARRPCPAPRRSRAGRRVGSATPRRVRAYSRPMSANCASHSGVQSTVAPPSTRSCGRAPGTGIGTAIAGRATPGCGRCAAAPPPSWRPVLPAPTIASARPSRTASAPRTSEDVLLRAHRGRRARRPSRSTSGARASSTPSGGPPPGRQRRDRVLAPDEQEPTPSCSAASSAPATISPRRPVAAHRVDRDR